MWTIIARKELKEAIRKRVFLVLALVFWALMGVTAYSSYGQYTHYTGQVKEAEHMFRQEWEEQKRNPHSAAHFGTYLFKPLSYLGLYDPGINSYTGNTYRVEAHNQSEINYAAAHDNDVQQRFGLLTIGLVFQLLMPLLVIFLCAPSITVEREHRILQVLVAQGLHRRELLKGKIAGNYALVLLITIPALLIMLVAVMLRENQLAGRFLLFGAAYLIYFFVITLVGTFISAISKTSSQALFRGLGFWVLFAVLIPRAAAMIAGEAERLPSRYEFNRKVDKAFDDGIDGDPDYITRRKNFEKETLKKYKVDMVTALPFNFDGLSIQNGEDYLTWVYLKLSREQEQIINRQQRAQEWFGLLSPFVSIQQLSMGISGTDYVHHVDFHHHAQRYRDQFIRVLNMDMANSKSAYLSYDYEVGPEFFKKMKRFNYVWPDAGWALRQHLISGGILLAWLLLLLCSINPVSKHIAYD